MIRSEGGVWEDKKQDSTALGNTCRINCRNCLEKFGRIREGILELEYQESATKEQQAHS